MSFREIDEGEGAIYYLAPVRVTNQETIQIVLEVTPADSRPIEVDFRHQIYVD